MPGTLPGSLSPPPAIVSPAVASQVSRVNGRNKVVVQLNHVFCVSFLLVKYQLRRNSRQDPESKEFKEICLPFDLHCLNEMAVSIDHGSRKLEIVDPNNRWIVNVLDGEAVEISDDQQFEYGKV